MQLFGDFVQGGAVEPFPVEQPGAGLVERVLLQALLLRPVKTFQLTIDRVIYADGGLARIPFPPYRPCARMSIACAATASS